MNGFLKKIAQDMKMNEREYTKEDFYYILKYIGVEKDTSLEKDIEKFYKDFVGNLSNSLVKYQERQVKSGENATYYIAFYTDKKADYKKAIKVYFPAKYEYTISALKTIFLYLIRNNIASQVKFHVKATNEAIVIRFYDEADVLPFINYCNNSFILKDLLVDVHPFMATMFGIGTVRDDNTVNTYNGTLSLMLEEYFKFLKANNSLDKASDLDFLDYVIRRGELEENAALKFDIKAIQDSIKAILNHTSILG